MDAFLHPLVIACRYDPTVYLSPGFFRGLPLRLVPVELPQDAGVFRATVRAARNSWSASAGLKRYSVKFGRRNGDRIAFARFPK